MPVTVHFVTDPSYADHVRSLLTIGPVWMVDSPENGKSARAIWNEGKVVRLTTYSPLGRNPEEQVLEIFETVDLHHEIDIFRVIGVALTERIRVYMVDQGFGDFEELNDGFAATNLWEER